MIELYTRLFFLDLLLAKAKNKKAYHQDQKYGISYQSVSVSIRVDAVRAEQDLEVSSECVEWRCHIYDFSLCLSGNKKRVVRGV